MIVRLAILTLLLALFAVGVSSLVQHDAEGRKFAFAPFSGCYDQGMVCAPQNQVR